VLRRLTFLLLFPLATAQAAPPLQPLIDATPPGGVLRPAPGTYAGPSSITKPMTLDGGGKVVVEGNAFRAVRDLTFANSPDNHILGNTLADGRYGMQFIFSPRARVKNNRLADTDTGIAVLYSPDLVVRGNTIPGATDGKVGGNLT